MGSYEVRSILALFFNLVALILGWCCLIVGRGHWVWGAWCGFGAGDSSFCFGKISVSSFRFFDSVSEAFIFLGGGKEAGRWIIIV